MASRKKYLTPQEILNLITSKQWATSNDVYLISGLGRNKVSKDINTIKTKLEKAGYRLPRGLLPMEEVINFYKININYLKKICNISLKNNTGVDDRH